MKKFSLYVLVLAFSAGSAAMVLSAMHRATPLNSDSNAYLATNAAFRDGLYLGRQAARSGDQRHIATGRWATDQDRSAFREGYQRGFSQILVARARVQNQ
jgi:hypothetical protein